MVHKPTHLSLIINTSGIKHASKCIWNTKMAQFASKQTSLEQQGSTSFAIRISAQVPLYLQVKPGFVNTILNGTRKLPVPLFPFPVLVVQLSIPEQVSFIYLFIFYSFFPNWIYFENWTYYCHCYYYNYFWLCSQLWMNLRNWCVNFKRF